MFFAPFEMTSIIEKYLSYLGKGTAITLRFLHLVP